MSSRCITSRQELVHKIQISYLIIFEWINRPKKTQNSEASPNELLKFKINDTLAIDSLHLMMSIHLGHTILIPKCIRNRMFYLRKCKCCLHMRLHNVHIVQH